MCSHSHSIPSTVAQHHPIKHDGGAMGIDIGVRKHKLSNQKSNRK